MYNLIQQPNKFPINVSKQKKCKKIHGKLFPNSIRCVICGPSGCGKTIVLYNLIVRKEGLKFTNVYVISQSLEQEKYRHLTDVFKYVGDEVKLFTSQTCEITPNDVEPHSIVIFDDVTNNNNISQFFTMGRHRNLNCFFLCQSYSKIPKQLIRDNANFIILFKQDDGNLKHVFNNHVGGDLTFKEFKNMCAECWREDYGFMLIDKKSPLQEGRYRCKFDSFFTM